MISILIPVYNFDVTAFVEDLQQQATGCNKDFEILVYEDGSVDHLTIPNAKLGHLDNVTYLKLSENLGRSKIRNKMSAEAKYDWQLFFDCDARTTSDQFVKNYINLIKDDPYIVFGGRVYEPNEPSDKKKLLRWRYGKAREVFSVEQRSRLPYKFFMTNNFLVHRSIIESNPFNTSLKGYGHEDTMFANDLKLKQVPVKHINNPLVHIGLEDHEEFLDKTEQGVKNLALLIKRDWINNNNKLHQTYLKLRRMNLCGITRVLLNTFFGRFKDNLLGTNPTLRNFDLYKLCILLNEMR